MEYVFSICNGVAVIGWVLLAVAPAHARVQLIAGRVIPLSLSAVYLVLIAIHFRDAEGGFSSLAGVAQLFENRGALLAGWMHYLAFDLFIGAWEARDAVARKLSRLILIPCLFLTLMLGPIGLLAYHAMRGLKSNGYAQ